MPCTVVVGAQWGDEGKGKIVDALSAHADVVARYQGGPNAGHSVRHRGETVVLHLVPSGILAGKRCLIGNGVVVDLARLREETAKLESLGVQVEGRLGVSPGAHLILPYHQAVERVSEQGPAAIGTTGRGIGYAYRDKASRIGLRIGDLEDEEGFVERVDLTLSRLRREFPEADDLAAMTGEGLYAEIADLRAWVKPFVTDVSAELYDALAQSRQVLLEGAQGTLLDLDHGTYPYVTSSYASAAGAPLGVGLGPHAVDRVIGVAKVYTTRVGLGPFPSEMVDEEARRLREAGEEYGATTGRPRRCGWLDVPALRYAARINGLDELILTKLDVFDAFERIQVAAAYERDGTTVTRFPAAARDLARCRPVYRVFPGWRSATSSVRRWGDLPFAAREYLEWIETETAVRIRAVSVGADRDAEVPRL
jgi:adenylosuccinate synthase